MGNPPTAALLRSFILGVGHDVLVDGHVTATSRSNSVSPTTTDTFQVAPMGASRCDDGENRDRANCRSSYAVLRRRVATPHANGCNDYPAEHRRLDQKVWVQAAATGKARQGVERITHGKCVLRRRPATASAGAIPVRKRM